jgi:hypothetical protein
MSSVLSGDNANCSDVIRRIAANDEGRHNDCVRQLSGVFIALQALAHWKRRRCSTVATRAAYNPAKLCM